ncbi:hypothetical protein WMY93_020578 [Mugilogobius chulae]|uniref:BESS domain-containing protein n=1 Tax=Mugilogobius chulae TaxID=88201 RepID=A0AAW0N899_9GOBI
MAVQTADELHCAVHRDEGRPDRHFPGGRPGSQRHGIWERGGRVYTHVRGDQNPTVLRESQPAQSNRHQTADRSDAQIAQLAALAKISSSISPIINKPGRKRRYARDNASPTDTTNTAEVSPKYLTKDNNNTTTTTTTSSSSSSSSPPLLLPSSSSPPSNIRPRDEDELFMLSFVPALKRLAPQKRCETKIRIQQIMYEAEFNVLDSERHGDSQD